LTEQVAVPPGQPAIPAHSARLHDTLAGVIEIFVAVADSLIVQVLPDGQPPVVPFADKVKLACQDVMGV